MIKGCQRKIIFIKGRENSPFENAYFVLRKDSEECCNGGDDILREADRIISETIPAVRKKRERRTRLKRRLISLAWFVLGVAAGVGVTVAVMLLG